MLDAPDCIATMGAGARARAESLFDEQLVIRRTLATYEKLLAQRASTME
jgi:hypothetical protein